MADTNVRKDATPVVNEGTDASTQKPPEDPQVLAEIKEPRTETRTAVKGAVTQRFDIEKFYGEFGEMLTRMEQESNLRTLADSLTPELERLLAPAEVAVAEKEAEQVEVGDSPDPPSTL